MVNADEGPNSSRLDSSFQNFEDLLKSQTCSPQVLEEYLNRNASRLFLGLDYFKHSTATSRQAFQKKKVFENLQGKVVQITENAELDFILAASSDCNLDENITAQLLRTYLRLRVETEENVEKFSYSDFDKDNLLSFYFDERTSLLSCILLLLHYDLQENYKYAAVITPFLDDLFSKDATTGFVDRILKQFEQRQSEPLPPAFATLKQDTWIKQSLAEQSLLLEIVFMSSYVRYVANAQILYAQLKFFKKINFGSATPLPVFDAEQRALVQRINYFSVLILLSYFLLEKLLYIDTSNHYLLDTKESLIKLIDREIVELSADPIHGPLFLVWGSVISILDDHYNGRRSVFCIPLENGERYVQNGFRLNVVPFFIKLLQVLDVEV